MPSKYGFESVEEQQRKKEAERKADEARGAKVHKWQQARLNVVMPKVDAVVRDVLDDLAHARNWSKYVLKRNEYDTYASWDLLMTPAHDRPSIHITLWCQPSGLNTPQEDLSRPGDHIDMGARIDTYNYGDRDLIDARKIADIIQQQTGIPVKLTPE